MSASAVASPGVGAPEGVALPESISAGLDEAFMDTGSTETGGEAQETVTDAELFGDEPEGDDLLAELNADGDEEGKEEEQPATEEVPAEAAKPTVEEAPEGGLVRDKANGRKEWVYTPEKGKRLHEGFVAAREAAEVLGEPLTKELVKSLHERASAHDLMLTHFETGEPEMHGGIIDHLIRRGDDAVASGAASVHPMVTFSSALPQKLLDSNVDAFIGMRNAVMQQFLPAVIHVAQGMTDGDEKTNLMLSAQHLEKYLFGNYTKPQAAAPPDPLAKQRTELETREARIREQETARATEAWNSWVNESKTANGSAIDSAIDEALQAVAKDYEKLPEQFSELKGKLKSKVLSVMKESREFGAKITNLQSQARAARTSERRGQLAEQIANAYKNRAKLTLDAVAAKETSDFANTLKLKANAANGRREQAQQRRTPTASGAQPGRSLVPPKTGGSFEDRWASQVADVFR